ncbi:hypothetical protein PtrSN002B_004601 [Pyrenophora tritici-repentis]|uniref:Uncharacterized protein n=1 Tax=Pyrenophora tritici-repentis TaxID=45151 RepID=A0A2W1E1Y2_9PLEO|nr:hypothetical protein PtrV1_04389 [Pyrenophora tritici-repentis]KAF7452076.1 hypothetical protein A1F99_038530 [Pyrenophora tritici-repentis]KAF7574806.1 hypothetical protein PtrM4_064300 [Pyrenophora tritici-repentis]KAG9386427.1 hypothetical protein A1F94_003177 [Pyrenophora tritici-repentis]KAI0588539.1 hypothetical protein Alg130_03314 [Pyrenophora tritici-repentis]
MPTPIDRAVQQRGPFFAFAAVVAGVAVWSIWGQDMFPSQDPTGDPETWTHEQCTTWLKHRNLHPSPLSTTAELLERIKANMRISREQTPGQ